MSGEKRIKARRGFAAMDPEKRRAIARKGGSSVPAELRSYSQDRDLAAKAGRKGGKRSKGGGRKPPTEAQQKAKEWDGLKKNPLYER